MNDRVICINIQQSTYEATYKPETVKKIIHIVIEEDMGKLTGGQCISIFNNFCMEQLRVDTREATAREQLYKLLDEHRKKFSVQRPIPRKTIPKKKRPTVKEYVKELVLKYGSEKGYRAKILKKVQSKYPKSLLTLDGISQIVSQMRKEGTVEDR